MFYNIGYGIYYGYYSDHEKSYTDGSLINRVRTFRGHCIYTKLMY